MNLTFFMYARRSSQGKRKQIESIPDQVKVLRQIRDTSELYVKVEFTESRSAMKPDTRPVFRDMIDRIIAGEANALLVWHINRLFRNSKEYGEVAYLLEIGVIQCIKTPEREYHPEDHGMFLAMEATSSAQYSKDLKKVVGRSVIEKAEKGWYPYKAKAGYVVDPFTKEVLPDPTRFAQLRGSVDLLLTRAYSVAELTVELNTSGFRTPRNSNGGNRPMSRSGMYRFLTDRFYQGEFFFQGVWQEGRHQPLVSRAEFAAIQKILGRSMQTRPQKHRFAYTGLMKCGLCGCQITAETHVKRYKTTGTETSYTYYHCTLRKGCKQHSITEENLEDQLLAKIERARLDPFFVDWALTELRRDEADQKTAALVIEPAKASVLRSLAVNLDSLWEMRHQQEITGLEFRERKAKYEAEILAIRTQAEHVASKAERDREKIKKALTFSRDAYQKFTRGETLERRQVALEFAQSYVLTLETLDVQVDPLIAKFMELEPKSHPPQQIGKDGSGVDHSTWRTILTDICKVVTDSEIA